MRVKSSSAKKRALVSESRVRCKTELLRSTKEPVDVVQGLWGTTLVAGKTTAVRIYFTNGNEFDSSKRIRIDAVRPNGSAVTLNWNSNALVRVLKSQNVTGPSLVVRIPGQLLPFVGWYEFKIQVFDNSGEITQSSILKPILFSPTMDLRMIFDVNASPPRRGEIQAGHDGIKRMAEIFPVRDGLGTLDPFKISEGPKVRSAAGPIVRWIGGPTVTETPLPGFRYKIVNWTDARVCDFLPQLRNQQPPVFDFYYSYRFTYPGKPSGGGRAGQEECGNPNYRYAHAENESGWPFGMVFAQETAHLLGLESETDTRGNRNPFFEPSLHSRKEFIDEIYVERGFNVEYNKPWSSTGGKVPNFKNQVYDVMYPYVSEKNKHDKIAFNWFDWEHLRQRLMSLPSTGPEAPISLRANWDLARILA